MPRLREFRWDAWALAAIRAFIEDEPSIIAIDTETTGLGFYDEPFAATLTWRGKSGELRSWYFDLEDPENRDVRIMWLRDILVGAPAWVFHNAKFDLQKLELIGAIDADTLERVELHDTQTAYMLLDENSSKRLKDLAVRILGYDDTIEVEVKSGPNKGTMKRVPKEQHRLNATRRKLGLKKEDGYHLLPREVLIPYALRDTEFTLQLHEILQPRLAAKEDEALLKLYRDSMRLKRALLRMEADGFNIDVPYTERMASEYGQKVIEGWAQIVELVGNEDFNPRSPAQLKRAFKARGIELEDTQEKTLAELDDELARALLQFRSDSKIHTTYLLALLREHRDGRMHPNFNDDGARTGRMSSSSAKE